ncbi:Serpentine receptor class r-10 [Caenorhabditis elegans]|uniref:Serpentine receptor class r-10 n=1 Tax=Caenorhabditis elegans TaxID=6239 RepID=O61883_CAEEL|nr:G-protein coupled receptors family 1 profile domain-containing protein [Caenorhabditis elegans]CCD72116.1 G-protein coupled receptors family 1 profile domain-containing protein [Caenorhabditis elegans]|eukprot:NP_504023.1 Seven TM Receptor [Caenorhabditis elegans]
MSDIYWIQITEVCSFVGFMLSVLGNSTLLVLLSGKSIDGIGTYRYLMITFCVFSLLFTILEDFIRPLMHHYNNTIIVLQRKRFQFSDSTARILTVSYCGCFAMCFVMFAVHFIYRYLVACHPTKLHYFRPKNFIFWLSGMLFIAGSWVAIAYVFFQEDLETRTDLVFILSTCYNLTPDDVGHVPYAFYKTQGNTRVIRWDNMIGVIHHMIVMTISISAVFYFGIKTYTRIMSFKGKSQKTKDLQNQFFTALVAQTVVPLIFMFIPNMVLTTAALIDGTFGSWANITVVMNHLYPAADPFVILFIIKGFRNSIRNVIYRCTKTKKASVSSVVRGIEAQSKKQSFSRVDI